LTPLILPALTGGQRESWMGLIQVALELPKGWTLIGGQMVQLHCWERGAQALRVTNDIDTVLDIRGDTKIIMRFTKVLQKVGFTPVGTTFAGHQYKWKRGGGEIDLLLPSHVGERALAKVGVTGGTTIETSGGQSALDFSETIEISMEGIQVGINRPQLLGAIFIKSAAYLNTNDRNKERHFSDIVNLASLLTMNDLDTVVSKRMRSRILTAISSKGDHGPVIGSIAGAEEGLSRLRIAMDA
jgi:hypothetical protein